MGNVIGWALLMHLMIAILVLMWLELQAAGVIIREIWRTWLLRNWRLIATGDYLAWAIDARHPADGKLGSMIDMGTPVS